MCSVNTWLVELEFLWCVLYKIYMCIIYDSPRKAIDMNAEKGVAISVRGMLYLASQAQIFKIYVSLCRERGGSETASCPARARPKMRREDGQACWRRKSVSLRNLSPQTISAKYQRFSGYGKGKGVQWKQHAWELISDIREYQEKHTHTHNCSSLFQD